MSHPNAPLTPEGRRRLCERVDAGRPIAHVAAEAGVSRQVVSKWYHRWQAEGEAGLIERSSRPATSPARTPANVEDRVEQLRREAKIGPVQIAGRLAEAGIVLAASTVYRILRRRGINRLSHLDPSGGQLREPVRRYEHDAPGDLVHVDVKKIGRIPDGGGWKVHGRGSDQDLIARKQKVGYSFIHSAVDDHSRLAYSEELPDEKATTAAAFWHRAAAFFAAHGIDTIHRCLTDNGPAYVSVAFGDALIATGTRHKRTRPYRPQTNGKAERYNRTLAQEWAYASAYDSNTARAGALAAFLHRYNYHRPHTALRGKPPASRCPAVNNVTGHNT